MVALMHNPMRLVPADERSTGTARVKRGLAEMLKGGVIMDVVTAEQAKIAEDAGAAAVMALERVPADIRRDGGVARMSDPAMIESIKEAVHGNLEESRAVYAWVVKLCVSLGADEKDLVPFEKYANAACPMPLIETLPRCPR